MNNKGVIQLSLMVLTIGSISGTVVSDLQEREQEIYHIIGEYWIDDAGNLQLGSKELGTPTFTLSETFMKRLTPDQIKGSVNTALSRLTQEQKDAYLHAIAPFLDELTDVRSTLKAIRNKLDTYASTLATYLNKTSQTILQMPTTNIKNLVSILPADKKAELATKVNIEEFNNIRTAFNVTVGTGKASASKTEDAFEATVTLPAHLKAGGRASSGKNIIQYGATDSSSDESD